MRKLVNFICVSVCLLPFTLFAQSSQELLQRAVLAGDVDKIIELADQAKEKDEHYLVSHMAKAVVLYEKGRYDESIASYNKAINAAPDTASEAYLGRSMARRKKGDMDGANEDVKKAQALRKEGKSIRHRQLNHHLAVKPKDREALLSRALDKFNSKAYAAAIEDFDTYIASVVNCENSMVYASKVSAQEMLGDTAGAITTCSDWLSVLPESAKAYQLRARLKKTVGDEQGSALDRLTYQSLVRQAKRQTLNDLTKAIEKNPNFAFGYHERAKLYMELGEYEEAEADLNKAGEIDPNSRQIKRLRKQMKKRGKALLHKEKDLLPKDTE